MKTSATIIVVATVALLWTHSVLAADKKPQDLIVGKWVSADEKDKGTSLEFAQDGAVKLDFGPDGMRFVFNGGYKFTDDKTLEITMEDFIKKGEKTTMKLSVKSLTDDEFVFLDAKGNERSLKRVKMAAPELPKKSPFN